jgi:hypothetical protein
MGTMFWNVMGAKVHVTSPLIEGLSSERLPEGDTRIIPALEHGVDDATCGSHERKDEEARLMGKSRMGEVHEKRAHTLGGSTLLLLSVPPEFMTILHGTWQCLRSEMEQSTTLLKIHA